MKFISRRAEFFEFYLFIFTLYISYETTFFKKIYCEVISKRILIIFAPEEAEIFKDYFLFQHDFP
jgi:hypothetical protein